MTNSQDSRLQGGRRLRRPNSGARADVPLISIVTVVLNGASRLERTVESVLSQDFHDFEYIVVDGGSTDGTLDILNRNEDKIEYWASEPDRGISDAFNKGIRIARGDLVGLLNAGDWYEPEAIAAAASAFESHPQADVICGSLRFWESGTSTIVCHPEPSRVERESSIYHPAVFIKRSAYLKYGMYDVGYRHAMDYELLLRFKRKGARFLAIDKTLANMMLDGVSSKHWYRGLQEVRKARSAYFPLYNVVYYHLLAVLKNLVARALKRSGLKGPYRAYWRARNRRIAISTQREERG